MKIPRFGLKAYFPMSFVSLDMGHYEGAPISHATLIIRVRGEERQLLEMYEQNVRGRLSRGRVHVYYREKIKDPTH